MAEKKKEMESSLSRYLIFEDRKPARTADELKWTLRKFEFFKWNLIFVCGLVMSLSGGFVAAVYESYTKVSVFNL